jgi:predicted enzyme related to lactoylglutathione lyase
MITSLAHVSLYVKDYDEAIRFFTDTIGLELRGDRAFESGYRWVTVGAKGQGDVALVLHIPKENGHGDPAAPRKQPTMVFHTDDCRGDIARFKQKGVVVTSEPEEVMWGIQAVFQDLYGNTHVLVQPSANATDTKTSS